MAVELITEKGENKTFPAYEGVNKGQGWVDGTTTSLNASNLNISETALKAWFGESGYISKLINQINAEDTNIIATAEKNLAEKTHTATTYEEFLDIATNKEGYIKAMWCGDEECELKIKEDTTATSRCIPFEQEQIGDKCICCGKPATKMVYWINSIYVQTLLLISAWMTWVVLLTAMVTE